VAVILSPSSNLSSCSGNFSFLSGSLSVSTGVRAVARRRPPPPVRARPPSTGRASPGVLAPTIRARPGDAGSDLGGGRCCKTHQHGWAPPCSTRALELGTEKEEQKERALQGLSQFLQDRANQKRCSRGRAGTALHHSTSHRWPLSPTRNARTGS